MPRTPEARGPVLTVSPGIADDPRPEGGGGPLLSVKDLRVEYATERGPVNEPTPFT